MCVVDKFVRFRFKAPQQKSMRILFPLCSSLL